MSEPRYYDRDGTLMTMEDWIEKWEKPEHKIVEKTDVEGTDSLVSTVWLGSDHRFGDDGPPLIFESLVFDGRMANVMERYATEDEARAGHAVLVEKVREEQAAFAEMPDNWTIAEAMRTVHHNVAIHAEKFGLDAETVLTALYREVTKGDD